jgi:hypothetical protein
MQSVAIFLFLGLDLDLDLHRGLQPDCSADRHVTGPCQSTIKAQTQKNPSAKRLTAHLFIRKGSLKFIKEKMEFVVFLV